VALHELRFDGRVFSLDAVKNAAYRMAATFDCEIRLDGNDIVCSLNLRDNKTEPDPDSVMARFRREVIDHDLRLRISSQTEGVRNLILAHAFSRTGIIRSE
jgi:His-Xaa-Ser system protein HxsD